MGLAPYGEPKYKDLIYKHLIDVRDEGSFYMDMSYFDYNVGLTMTNKKFNNLFGGPPRAPKSKLTQKEMDLARSVQEVIEEKNAIYNRQTGNKISESDWKNTLKSSEVFHDEFIKFNKNGILLIGCSKPWEITFKNNLSSLDNGVH